MEHKPVDPISREYKERATLESFRNGVYNEIRKHILYTTGLRNKKNSLQISLDTLITKYNTFNEQLGYPLQTKTDLMLEILQPIEQRARKTIRDATDEDIDDAFRTITSPRDPQLPFETTPNPTTPSSKN
jgi:hypothetical protein